MKTLASELLKALELVVPEHRIENIIVHHGAGQPIEIINIWGAGIRKILPGDPEYASYQESAE